MATNLDMSLDDLIRTNKQAEKLNQAPRGRGRGFRRGVGPDRRVFNRGAVRPTPYMPPYQMPPPVQAPEPIWHQQGFLFNERAAGDAKLHVSNLDIGVSNEDIKVLFSEVGDLKKYSINYDRSGKSKGTAEVVYYHERDALGAIKRYNGVELDGRPMKIELVGTSLVTPVPFAPSNDRFLRNPIAPVRSPLFCSPFKHDSLASLDSDQDTYGSRGRTYDYGRGRVRGRGHGFARGRGRGRSYHAEKKSVDDLDAELDKYHFEAMQIK